MIVEAKGVVRIRLSEIEVLDHKTAFSLDPVTVFLEDSEAGKGKITIECYGKAWSSFWPAIGKDRTVAQFFCSCDEDYLAKNLSDIKSSVVDIDRINELAEKADLETMEEGYMNYKTLNSLYGDDWRYDLPEIPNHEYVYLCRIINAVKDGLKIHFKDMPT